MQLISFLFGDDMIPIRPDTYITGSGLCDSDSPILANVCVYIYIYIYIYD